MALRINVGLSKKRGLADYGSVGTSCHVEFEAEQSLLHSDLDKFHQHVRNAYAACAQAVNEELARQTNGAAATPGNGFVSRPPNGSRTNGNGKAQPNGRKATASQVRAIRAIASRQGLDLGQTLQNRFAADRPEDLSIGEASQLIDELKAPSNGTGGRR